MAAADYTAQQRHLIEQLQETLRQHSELLSSGRVDFGKQRELIKLGHQLLRAQSLLLGQEEWESSLHTGAVTQSTPPPNSSTRADTAANATKSSSADAQAGVGMR